MARADLFVVVDPRHQSLPLSHLPRPNRGPPHSLRRHRLQIRQRLAVAVRAYCGKRLVISLRVRIKPQRQGPERTQLQIRTQRSLSQLCIIPLQRRAVPARFVQIPTTREYFTLLADFSSHHHARGPVPHSRSDINRPPLRLRRQNVSVRVKYSARNARFPFSLLSAGPQRKVGRSLVAVRSIQRNSAWLRRPRNELHPAAQRIAAVQARPAFLRNLHIRNGFHP